MDEHLAGNFVEDIVRRTKSQPEDVSVQADIEKIAFREAFKLNSSTMPGIFAWGVVSGMAMVKSGLTLWQALGMKISNRQPA